MARIFNTFGPRMHFSDGNVCMCVYVHFLYKFQLMKTSTGVRADVNCVVQALITCYNYNCGVNLLYCM